MLPRRQNIARLLKGQLPQFTAPLNRERRLEFQMWEVKVDGGGRRPITDDSLAPLHRPPGGPLKQSMNVISNKEEMEDLKPPSGRKSGDHALWGGWRGALPPSGAQLYQYHGEKEKNWQMSIFKETLVP